MGYLSGAFGLLAQLKRWNNYIDWTGLYQSLASPGISSFVGHMVTVETVQICYMLQEISHRYVNY